MDTSDIKPSTIMLIAGGVVLFISTFLDWYSVSGESFGGFESRSFGYNAWETDGFGLLGIFCALIGLVIGGAVAAKQFGNVTLPDSIAGFTSQQLHLILSAFALLITVAIIFRGEVGIGLWLAVIASGVMVAGAVMDQREGEVAASPPTQF